MQTALDLNLIRSAASRGDWIAIRSAAERTVATGSDDLTAEYLSCAAAFLARDFATVIPRMMSAFRCIDQLTAVGRLAGSERIVVAAVTNHLVSFAECLIWEFGQPAFASDLVAVIAERAHGNKMLTTGSSELADRIARQADRFWQVPSAQNGVHTVWIDDTPLQVQVEPTNHCNLKCTMCPRTTAMTRPLGHLDLGLWRHILESWSGRARTLVFDAIVDGVAFTHRRAGGLKLYYLGETLMHPEFDRLMQIGAELDCHMGLQTNGVLLSRRSIRERLLNFGPSTIGVSLDGFDPETYSTVRAGSKWDVVKRGIEAFIEERDRRGLTNQLPIRLTSILSENTPEMRERVALFLKTIAGGSLEIDFLGLTTQHEAEFINGGGKLESYDWKRSSTIRPHLPSCAEPVRKMQILWDGTVTPCAVDVNADVILGHARHGVDAVWRSEPMRRLHRAHASHALADFPACQTCLGVDAACVPAARVPVPA
jgi:pyruvate-formate lyase-activating enzyme